MYTKYVSCCYVHYGLHKRHMCIFLLHKIHSCILACLNTYISQILTFHFSVCWFIIHMSQICMIIPTANATGSIMTFYNFWGNVNSVCNYNWRYGTLQKYTYNHHMYSDTLVYPKYYLRNLESEILLNSMAILLNISNGNIHHVAFVNAHFYNISRF